MVIGKFTTAQYTIFLTFQTTFVTETYNSRYKKTHNVIAFYVSFKRVVKVNNKPHIPIKQMYTF